MPQLNSGDTAWILASAALVLLMTPGLALLWFGWFGFNAGSALAADGLAATAFLDTQVAAAAAAMAWIMVERLRDGRATTLGVASGAVAGLVAITPASGSVSPLGALAVGAVASVACAYAVGLKYRLGYDDSLDVVGIHLVGGVVGSLLVGFFATAAVTGGQEGLIYGGGPLLLGKQVVAVARGGGEVLSQHRSEEAASLAPASARDRVRPGETGAGGRLYAAVRPDAARHALLALLGAGRAAIRCGKR